MRQELDVLQVWSVFYQEISEKWWLLLKSIVLPSLILAMLDIFFLSSTDAPPIGVILWVPYLVCVALIAISCHRIILTDKTQAADSWGFYWDADVGRYILALIGTSLLLMLVAIILILPVLFLAFLLALVVGDSMVLTVGLSIAMLAPLSYLMARISIVLPARAVGDKSSFETLIRLSVNNGWRLVLTTVVPIYVMGFAYIPIEQWLGRQDGSGLLLPDYLYFVFTSLVTISLLSCSYRRLLEINQPMAESE